MDISALDPRLVADCRDKGIDLDHSLEVLELVNARARNSTSREETAPRSPELPAPDDPRIVDAEGTRSLALSALRARKAFDEFALPEQLLDRAHPDPASADKLIFDEEALREIGRRLYPKAAFGVLNGGSATSYADAKKNRAIDEAAFEAVKDDFDCLAARFRGQPKGITPAYFNEDGSDGPSFLELKFRALLVEAAACRTLEGMGTKDLLPVFQMSSDGTKAALEAAYNAYRDSPLLKELIAGTACDPTQVLDATQPLLAALSPAKEDGTRGIFDRAWGKEHSALALPGGHGENFRVLKGVYTALREKGIRFAWLGNVDNSGYTVDPVSLASLALSGRCAAFEFAGKSALDVKGGVLVKEGGNLSVRDIGQSISWEEIHAAEERGGRAVFNCATGLFDLDYLVPRLDEIARRLPLHVTDQNKESGLYAQAEQTTWEVLGLLDEPLILTVPRPKRFLPAKMLLETLMASPRTARLKDNEAIPKAVREDGERLRLAMKALLEEKCALKI